MQPDLVSDDALDNWILRNAYTQHHIAGTCKMGPASDSMAVVSQHGHVHGIDGLPVADASVMPDVIRANTNATTIIISERVSEFITAGLTPPNQPTVGANNYSPLQHYRAQSAVKLSSVDPVYYRVALARSIDSHKGL